tara:strand:- start:210 stop:464 length:255 start_codon:yes stop_codon:yes gene_type:complete
MKTTHEGRLLQYLTIYKKITIKEAMEDLGISRLSAVIFNLRKHGHDVETKMIEVSTRWKDEKGKTKMIHIGEYNLLSDNANNFK